MGNKISNDKQPHIDNPQPLEFVHIPKTGGSAIVTSAFLFGVKWGGSKMYPFRESPQVFHSRIFAVEPNWFHDPEQSFPGSKTFAVVRNPLSRIVSEYNFIRHNPDCKNESSELNKWVKTKLKLARLNYKLDDHHFAPQYMYIYDKEGKRKVDYVLKYENLDSEFKQLMKEFGLKVKLTKTKINSKKCNMKVSDLDKVSIQMIKDFYKDDFALFDY